MYDGGEAELQTISLWGQTVLYQYASWYFRAESERRGWRVHDPSLTVSPTACYDTLLPPALSMSTYTLLPPALSMSTYTACYDTQLPPVLSMSTYCVVEVSRHAHAQFKRPLTP